MKQAQDNAVRVANLEREVSRLRGQVDGQVGRPAVQTHPLQVSLAKTFNNNTSEYPTEGGILPIVFLDGEFDEAAGAGMAQFNPLSANHQRWASTLDDQHLESDTVVAVMRQNQHWWILGGGGDSQPFADIMITGVLYDPLIPYRATSTGDTGDLFVDGHTFVIFGRRAFGNPPTIIKNIQINRVVNYCERWAPSGSHFIAAAHDTGAVTTGQPQNDDNGLPIYAVFIVDVEPPEFTIELELDSDLPPVRLPSDIDYTEVADHHIQNIWGYINRDEFLNGNKTTFNPALLAANRGQPIIATVRRKSRPLPGASPGEDTDWLVTIMAVPANTLAAYATLSYPCRTLDQEPAIADVKGFGWKIPEEILPTTAVNIWGLMGPTGARVKLMYVPAGFDPVSPQGKKWFIDMIQPNMIRPVIDLRINDLTFQSVSRRESVIWSDNVDTAWQEWGAGELCPPTSPGSERAADGQTDGQADGGCVCED